MTPLDIACHRLGLDDIYNALRCNNSYSYTPQRVAAKRGNVDAKTTKTTTTSAKKQGSGGAAGERTRRLLHRLASRRPRSLAPPAAVMAQVKATAARVTLGVEADAIGDWQERIRKKNQMGMRGMGIALLGNGGNVGAPSEANLVAAAAVVAKVPLRRLEREAAATAAAAAAVDDVGGGCGGRGSDAGTSLESMLARLCIDNKDVADADIALFSDGERESDDDASSGSDSD
jgi:hypothetical protein